MKIAVIGVGGSGSAALRFLARAGHEAVGYEQFAVGHDRGSSHGHSRIIRRTYPDAFHTRMMARSYALWEELLEESGEDLFVRCGGLTFGPRGDAQVGDTRRALEESGLGYEMLSRDEAAARFPALDIGPGAQALFQADSGFLRASECVLAQARLAKTAGAVLREHAEVKHLQEQDDGVLISAEGETQRYDAVIITAGPWMGKLLAPLGLPLRTELRQVVYAGIARNEENFQPAKLPIWIEEPEEYYGFPLDGRLPGMKFALHHAGMAFDPDAPERPLMDDLLTKAMEHIVHRFPDLSGEILSAQSCLYTLTPDERFILDHAPGSRRVVLCSGCSGHAFKFTILLGEIAARLAAGGGKEQGPAEWRAGRLP